MASVPTLIFCGGGNKPFAQIAIAAGYRYGSQLPCSTYGDVYFADQDWKKPNRAAYMKALAKHRPHMATVVDWEEEEQLADVLDWAEEASQYVQQVVIIPKVVSIERIPDKIGNAEVVLGYSVPTRFGGTIVPLWSFGARPVHLLGGSPQKQMNLARYLNVVSVDGNMHQRMANSRCVYWKAQKGPDGHFHLLNREVEDGGPTEAFRRSCTNIFAEWHRQFDRRSGE